jgi:small conductance mechanosensitive channel
MEPTTLEKVSGFLDLIFRPVMTKIVVALLILLVSFIIGRLLGKITGRILREFGLNKTFDKATGLNVELEQAIGTGVSYLVYFVGIIMTLNHLGLTVLIGNIVLVFVVSVVVLTVFLWIKDFIPNIIAGTIIRRNQLVKVGDCILFQGMEGEITKTTLLDVRLITKQNDLMLIPNGLLISEKVVKRR